MLKDLPFISFQMTQKTDIHMILKSKQESLKKTHIGCQNNKLNWLILFGNIFIDKYIKKNQFK